MKGTSSKSKSDLPLPVTAPTHAQHKKRVLLAVAVSMGGLFYYMSSHCAPVTVARRNPAYLIEAEHGAVASENKRCSDIGVDVLKDGGNAVDAAISTTLCIGVVNMFSCVLLLVPRSNY